MLPLVIGQSGCASRETDETREGSRSEVRGFWNVELRIAHFMRVLLFPALLAIISMEAILANDHQAHNATAVSDAGRPANP